MTQEPPIVLNESAHRFELDVDGHLAHVEFERLAGGIAYLHTVVPKELGGRGIGTRLVRHVLDYARENGLMVRPDCSFVKSYIDKHPEYHAISLAVGGGA